jgi:ribosomal protein S2
MNDLYITKKTKNSITTDLNIAFISNIGYNVTVAKEIEKLFIPIIGITDSSSNY